MTFWKRQNYRDKKRISGYQLLGMEVRADYERAPENLGKRENFCISASGGRVWGRGGRYHVEPQRWQEEAPEAAQEASQGDGQEDKAFKQKQKEGQAKAAGKASWPQVELRSLAKSNVPCA